MDNTFSIIISSIFQVLLFSLIPFVWWMITARKTISFFSWVGLKKTVVANKKTFILWVAGCVFVLFICSFITPILIDQDASTMGQFAGQGSRLIPSALVYGLIQTGLSEEILFRGFLGKRLISKFGFSVGNTVQALAFGLMHGVLFYFISTIGLGLVLIITLLTGFAGWVMGYINEKQANGSIIPSYLIHGVGNALLAILALYNII